MSSSDFPPKPGTRSEERQVPYAVPSRSRAGMTLVELAVTLTVLMLAASVVVPSFTRFQEGSQLQWTVRRTLALAGEARGLAVSGDAVVRLEYDGRTHGMRMVIEPPENDAEEAPAAQEAEPPVNERRTSDTRFFPLPPDVSVKVEQNPASGEQSFRFYPDGRSDDVHIRLEREGFPPVVLAMNARTGRLRVEEQAE